MSPPLILVIVGIDEVLRLAGNPTLYGVVQIRYFFDTIDTMFLVILLLFGVLEAVVVFCE